MNKGLAKIFCSIFLLTFLFASSHCFLESWLPADHHEPHDHHDEETSPNASGYGAFAHEDIEDICCQTMLSQLFRDQKRNISIQKPGVALYHLAGNVSCWEDIPASFLTLTAGGQNPQFLQERYAHSFQPNAPPLG
ncbi:hypothetical protein A2V82_00480 [candidate division KSB1 bacterium RBG_16_48_16]|nr:MAG: hypothetical protein A2V82_00480 [candidate division KSB1 bacterium RBG_16_48_16]